MLLNWCRVKAKRPILGFSFLVRRQNGCRDFSESDDSMEFLMPNSDPGPDHRCEIHHEFLGSVKISILPMAADFEILKFQIKPDEASPFQNCKETK
jgi:hypothetical protein